MEGYCLRCRAKGEIEDPQPVYTKGGRPGVRGKCPRCGSKIFRMGRTPAHASSPIPKPKGRQRRASQGGGRLVVVESPTKARTMRRFLGRGYEVRASVGHVRDLLKSRLSVDVENDFTPTYRVPREKREVVKGLREAAQRAAEIYLATDPDREGEAIAWHLLKATEVEDRPVHRVVFHEITKSAVDEAFANPRGLDMQLVDAQQARRILDRLVGYKISPLLWHKVRSRLSAGRVQSVALRLVVEREREIEAFVPEEFWTLEAELAKEETRGQEEREAFWAKLTHIRGEKVELKNQGDIQAILDDLEGASYVVEGVEARERRRQPWPPFITSSLQQEASRRLRFSPRRTMRVAQQLYEGVSLGRQGSIGLITYMRTDSVNVAAVAQAEARGYIAEKFGPEFVPPYTPRYKSRAKRAQEAHEAIRPTSVRREPQVIKKFLSRDQYRLYELIWKRFLASQMAPALLDVTTVAVKAGDPQKEMPYLFSASGSLLKFPGFLAVYGATEMKRAQEKEGGEPLPEVTKGESLDCLRLLPEQHFTKPPARYSEATLVKALEEYGIGRPSTYAPIISTIQSRGYVERVDRVLRPTELGMLVCALLVEHFPDIMDVGFTAQMEEELDLIASGEKERVHVLRDFYGPFQRAVDRAGREMEEVEVKDQPAGEACDKCGSPMVIKFGRYGKFVACSNYPGCKNTKPYLKRMGVFCPRCGGELVERRTRRGRPFYGCSNYPSCDFATWRKPSPKGVENGERLIQSG